MNNTTCPKCGKPSDPRSKKKGYCTDDMQAAREAWKKMISEKPSKEDREKKHQELLDRALMEGGKAADAAVPTPIMVEDYFSGQTYHVPQGLCGFAWVTIRPGNSSFALWLVKNGYARKAYGGGVVINSGSVGGQSIQIKEAWAQAVSAVLCAGGIKAVPGSRLD